ncbi:unnamed protein product [Echinostoma caproni]|uniref:Uncharacterized protein n=1 Tax=Echinostoma caproni TaxID=27848 RepID=A0A3P8HMC9_9TREM|nr:unnamed protein product [Echinostoma caproni]
MYLDNAELKWVCCDYSQLITHSRTSVQQQTDDDNITDEETVIELRKRQPKNILELEAVRHRRNEEGPQPTLAGWMTMVTANRKDRPGDVVHTQSETGEELWATVARRASVDVIPSAVPQRLRIEQAKRERTEYNGTTSPRAETAHCGFSPNKEFVPQQRKYAHVNVDLPRVELTHFDGNPEQYCQFIRQYEYFVEC